jgi:energy-converting hydrogenase A subunit M
MSFNPKLEFEKLKLLYPGLKEPPTMSKFDKDYFYMYFGPMIELGVFMKNVGVEEDLAFVANKYGRKGRITKIVIKYSKNIEKMKLEILKHIFFNTADIKIDANDLIFMTSYKYFRNVTPPLLRLIRERCENINVSMIAFNYLEGVINEADILSILIKCNGFCDFGFKEPKNSDIKRLYEAISNEKLKFIEFFCTKTNIDCVKGQIGYKEIVNSNMDPFHIAIWQCGLSLCDIINFYLENNISSLPTPLNWISFLRIPLKFLCEIDCINMLTRNPATLLSTTALPTFVKKVLLECNPAVCTVISSKSGISTVLSGTGLDYLLVPGRFLCETVCCGSGSTSICNCCKTLRIRDLRNKFSIYKKMAMCLTNFICELTKNGDVLNDIFAVEELRQFILFLCNLIQNPNLQDVVKFIENKINAGVKEVINILEESQTISFDDFFDKLVKDQACNILKGYSKILGGQISVVLTWVCEKFSEIGNVILKGIFRTIKSSIQNASSVISKPTLEQVITVVVNAIVSAGLLCRAVTDKLPRFWGIEKVCSKCSNISQNLLKMALRGNVPSLSEIADLIVTESCLSPCSILQDAIGGVQVNAFCTCGNLVTPFAKSVIKGNPPSVESIAQEVLKCANPCNIPGVNFVCENAEKYIVVAAEKVAEGVGIAAYKVQNIAENIIAPGAEKGFNETINGINTAINEINKGINEAINGVNTAIEEVGKAINVVGNAMEDVGQGISDVANEIGNVFTGGGGGCLIASTEVHMNNGYWKKISDINIGEYILGPDGKPNKVITIEKTFVKNERVFLAFTFDHPFIINNQLYAIKNKIAMKKYPYLGKINKFDISDYTIIKNQYIYNIILENEPHKYMIRIKDKYFVMHDLFPDIKQNLDICYNLCLIVNQNKEDIRDKEKDLLRQIANKLTDNYQPTKFDSSKLIFMKDMENKIKNDYQLLKLSHYVIQNLANNYGSW